MMLKFGVGGVWWVTHRILMSAPVPLGLIEPLNLLVHGFGWDSGVCGLKVRGRGLTVSENKYPNSKIRKAFGLLRKGDADDRGLPMD